MPTSSRSYSAGTSYYLSLNNHGAGYCHDADFPTFSSLVFKAGMGMSREFYDWIGLSMSSGGPARSGSIASVDWSNKILYRDTFSSALISQVEFPAFDAADKNPQLMTLTLQTNSVAQDTAATGQTVAAVSASKSKLWLPANFRMTITGVDTKYVSKIGGLLFSPLPGAASKDLGELKKLASGCSGTDLVLTIKEQHAAGIRSWFQSGNAKDGSIDALAPNMKAVLFTLSFRGLTGSSIDPAFPLNPAATVTAKFSYSGASFCRGHCVGVTRLQRFERGQS